MTAKAIEVASKHWQPTLDRILEGTIVKGSFKLIKHKQIKYPTILSLHFFPFYFLKGQLCNSREPRFGSDLKAIALHKPIFAQPPQAGINLGVALSLLVSATFDDVSGEREFG